MHTQPRQREAGPKALSLVFEFQEQLRTTDDDFGGPTPDYGKWTETHLYADTATAGDNALDDELSEQERQVWSAFAKAQEATGDLLDLYRENPQQFCQIARQLSFLPCLLSWHPDAERFNRALLAASGLGRDGLLCELRAHPGHAAR